LKTSRSAADRLLEALVGVGDAQADAVEAAALERAEELAPERLGLDLADIEADHLAPAGLVDGTACAAVILPISAIAVLPSSVAC
jgi:hypothetical protein